MKMWIWGYKFKGHVSLMTESFVFLIEYQFCLLVPHKLKNVNTKKYRYTVTSYKFIDMAVCIIMIYVGCPESFETVSISQ